MSRYPQQQNQANAKPGSKRSADGSDAGIYPDGRRLILESALAKSAVLCEAGPVNYNDPPPPPAAADFEQAGTNLP